VLPRCGFLAAVVLLIRICLGWALSEALGRLCSVPMDERRLIHLIIFGLISLASIELS